ncbi:MAG: methyltransferase domain-containing protein [Dehalococcoidia bacterium]
MSEPEYVFDNARSEAQTRLTALEAFYDPVTIRHLEPVVTPGSHCLEVGAGSGSIARWMSGRVGPTGRVVATDINTRLLASVAASNVEVRQHNIVSDPLEAGAFDLAHTRLVLVHLPERKHVVERLIAALKPGGWLVLQEFESVRADPATFEGEHLLKTLVAMQDLMVDRGADNKFGRRLFPILSSAGLDEVAAEGHIILLQGGRPEAELLRANFSQLHEALITSGRLTEQEFSEDVARLDDPAIIWPSQILWTVRGRKRGP